MIKPIYNLNSIRPPITGVGRYTLELINGQLTQNQPVVAVYQGKLYQGQTLKRLTKSLLETTISTNGNLRKLIGSLPFSRDIYHHLKKAEFRRIRSRIEPKPLIEHDVNYANPNADVITLFDTSHINARSSHPRHRVTFLDRYFKQLLANQRSIITISEAVKQELITHCSIEPERIHVTPLAADANYHPRTESSCSQRLISYGINYHQYVLSLATVEPRKNLSRSIDAYLNLPPATRQQFPLVIAGAPGWKSSSLMTRINLLAEQGEITYLGYVSERDLPFLYAGSTVFLYPSLYEGFGLPLLEAMQSGSACVTSNSGALAEVSNGAALEVDPTNVIDITTAISTLLTNPESNAQHRQLAIDRANHFSWSHTVELTRAVYESI
ncbi:glycosyltransferase family 4 protein [Arenicella xantha]|uniref:Alpha-1,3-rhamnosyl/mannosyltransferase n=1 Tax=Arenicella xantha TaxID=644221 RepID=A0A395JJU8_9GAMM|nr:glycosyltransferase family 1 protein [Arenicella xantha]RBP51002.1 alpha-1,3-rhamnosyl/mannosyltransferase [Arenicella xantha]